LSARTKSSHATLNSPFSASGALELDNHQPDLYALSDMLRSIDKNGFRVVVLLDNVSPS